MTELKAPVVSALKARLQKAITDSMKARDSLRTQLLRQAMSHVKKKEIDDNRDLEDAEVEKVLVTFVKQLNESLEQAKTAKRDDLVKGAEYELGVIKEFLPQAMSEGEVEKIVISIVASLKSAGTLPVGGAGMGMVMKQTMAQVGSRADGKIVQAAVKKALA
jgi:uncharacterized protein YqeY